MRTHIVIAAALLSLLAACKKKEDAKDKKSTSSEKGQEAKVDLPKLTADPAMPAITPAEMPPLEAVAFRMLDQRSDKGWPVYEAYNLSTRPVVFMAIKGYAYDKDGKQVATTATPLSWNGTIAPGAKSDFDIQIGAFPEDQVPASAVSYELCYDSIKLDGDADATSDSGRCPAEKPRGAGKAAAADAPAVPTPTAPPAGGDLAATAQEMCRKPMETITAADARTNDTFVAHLQTPRYRHIEDSKEAYDKSGNYEFVGKKAAVVDWSEVDPSWPMVSVVLVSDDTDPCTVDRTTLITSAGNPAVEIRLQKLTPGESKNWDPVDTKTAMFRYGQVIADPASGEPASAIAGHRGQGFYQVSTIEKGTSLEMTVHSCEPQSAEMDFMGVQFEYRYFAIGPVKATFCPGVGQ